jgi:uncharacterized protein
MRISEALVTLAAGVWVCCGGPAFALDAKIPTPAAAAPMQSFKSVKDAFRLGIQDYNNGEKATAARALEFAAQQGHALARWKLGRMYADGDGVPHDDLKAFEHFSRIAEEHSDETPDAANARVVSSAFVALGAYYLDGIANTYVKRNPVKAREMFQYAASYFGDPDAQYSLARLHLDGAGGRKDSRQALGWLSLSAEKGHVQAQALLGQLLFFGDAGVKQRARGLMWLTMARDAADASRDGWIIDLYTQAFSTASLTDREQALVYLEQHISKRP